MDQNGDSMVHCPCSMQRLGEPAPIQRRLVERGRFGLLKNESRETPSHGGEKVRPFVLAVLLTAGLATTARAANDSQNIRINPDSTLVIAPGQAPPPSSKQAAPAINQTTAPAAQPAPLAAPVPQPVSVPVAESKPWPENVPSLKPGTDKAMAATAARNSPSKPTSTAGQNQSGQNQQDQVAALPPAPANAAALTPTKLTLQAAIADGAKAITEPLQWTLSKPGNASRKIGDQVASMTGPRGEFSVPPGNYVVTIKHHEAVVSQPLTVGSVAIVKTIVINTSIVGISLIPYTGAKVAVDPVHWEVFATALGRPGPDSKVADAVAPSTSFTLAAGYYVVRSHYHGVHTDLAMLIEPGLLYSFTVDLYAANLVPQVISPSGKPVKDVKWKVVRLGTESDGTHAIVATDDGASPTFLIREGSYIVIATGSDGSVGQTPIAVTAGKTHRIKVILKVPTTSVTKTNTSG
jgi:hypothetical protein